MASEPKPTVTSMDADGTDKAEQKPGVLAKAVETTMQTAAAIDDKFKVTEKVKDVSCTVTDKVKDAASRGMEIATNVDEKYQVTTKVKDSALAAVGLVQKTDEKYQVTSQIKAADEKYGVTEGAKNLTARGTDILTSTYDAVKQRDPTGKIQVVEDMISPLATGLITKVTNLASTRRQPVDKSNSNKASVFDYFVMLFFAFLYDIEQEWKRTKQQQDSPNCSASTPTASTGSRAVAAK